MASKPEEEFRWPFPGDSILLLDVFWVVNNLRVTRQMESAAKSGMVGPLLKSLLS